LLLYINDDDDVPTFPLKSDTHKNTHTHTHTHTQKVKNNEHTSKAQQTSQQTNTCNMLRSHRIEQNHSSFKSLVSY